MVAAPSQIGIYNVAMAELGTIAHITSLTDATASRANVLWDDLSQAMLEDYPWNFLIGRATLNATSDSMIDANLDEYKYACRLPATCARWLPPAPGEPNFFRGEREGQFLLLNVPPPVRIRFIRNDVPIAEWPRYFVRAMSAALAALLAEGITQSESIKNDMTDKAEVLLRRAKRLDANESGGQRRAPTTARSTWLQARTTPHFHLGGRGGDVTGLSYSDEF
jgi:hypothetical protein